MPRPDVSDLIARRDQVLLSFFGVETDIIYSRGVDLPGFATFPLLEEPAGRSLLKGYLRELVDIARVRGAGALLDTCTWMANPDRAATLGYAPADLAAVHVAAVRAAAEVRDANPDVLTLVSGQLGPRRDGYRSDSDFSADDAHAYHAAQVEAMAAAGADLVMAATISDVDEAIGIVRAAADASVPVLVAVTVETDGRLPSGALLRDAISAVDAATAASAAGYLVNCAHPDHVALALDGATPTPRLVGVVVNASRQSHAELDAATRLDAGDPQELADGVASLRTLNPQFTVLGGCCGTSMRHMDCIAERVLRG